MRSVQAFDPVKGVAPTGLYALDSRPSTNSLPLVFALADLFEHGEPGLLGVRDG
jgi:hypothetical protein